MEPTLTIRPQPRSRMPGDDGAGEDPRRQDQRAVGRLPLVELVVEGAAERRAAGVGDEDVDRAQRLLDLAGQRREALEVGGVGDEGRGAPSPDLARAASSSRSRERLAIATRAPSRASAAAIARPIPRLAPITSATRPSSPSPCPT